MTSVSDGLNNIKQSFRHAVRRMQAIIEAPQHDIPNAIINHDLGMVRYLSRHLDHPEINNALQIAAMEDADEIAKFLVEEKGASSTLLALSAAVSRCNKKVADYLGFRTPTCVAYYGIYSGRVKGKMDQGVLSLYGAPEGIPHPLSWAVMGDNVEFLKANRAEILNIADTNAQSVETSAGGLFRRAASSNAVKCLKFLNENYTIDINQPDQDITCLAEATSNGHKEAMQYLYEECGADPEAGKYSAHYMATYTSCGRDKIGHEDLISILGRHPKPHTKPVLS